MSCTTRCIAACYQRQFKPVHDVADSAGEVWVGAETKIGTELAKMPKAQRGAGPGRGKVGAKAGPTFGGPTLEDIGVTKKRASRARKLAELPVAERKAARRIRSGLPGPKRDR